MTLSLFPANIPGSLRLGRGIPRLDFHLAKPLRNSLLTFVASAPMTHVVRPLMCALLCCIQGQGALSERLRSFSMQDLTTIRGDGAPAPSGPPPPGSGRVSGKHSQPKMSRSASESAGSSGRCLFTLPLFYSLGFVFTEKPSPSGGMQPGICPVDLPPTEMVIRLSQAFLGDSAQGQVRSPAAEGPSSSILLPGDLGVLNGSTWARPRGSWHSSLCSLCV